MICHRRGLLLFQPTTLPLKSFEFSCSELIVCYFVCMKNCVCHDEFLYWKGFNQIFEKVVGAETVKTKAIDIFGSHFFQNFHLFFCGSSCSNEIIVQDNIPTCNILSDVLDITEEAIVTMIVKEFESLTHSVNVLDIFFCRFCPH